MLQGGFGDFLIDLTRERGASEVPMGLLLLSMQVLRQKLSQNENHVNLKTSLKFLLFGFQLELVQYYSLITTVRALKSKASRSFLVSS